MEKAVKEDQTEKLEAAKVVIVKATASITGTPHPELHGLDDHHKVHAANLTKDEHKDEVKKAV